jgi:hypothetical protein
MSYYYFNLTFEHLLSKTQTTLSATQYSDRYCRDHWMKYLYSTSGQSLFVDLEQLSHPPNQTLPYYLFSFTRVFFTVEWGDRHRPIDRSQQAFDHLTRCAEFLALALECDPAEAGLGDGWLYKGFDALGMDTYSHGRHGFEVRQEQATALQCIVDRMSTAVGAKVLMSFLYLRILSLTQRFSM